MYTENTYRTIDAAKAEVERVWGDGEGMGARWVMRRPSGSYYVASDRRYHDLPAQDTAAAVIQAKSGVWTDF